MDLKTISIVVGVIFGTIVSLFSILRRVHDLHVDLRSVLGWAKHPLIALGSLLTIAMGFSAIVLLKSSAGLDAVQTATWADYLTISSAYVAVPLLLGALFVAAVKERSIWWTIGLATTGIVVYLGLITINNIVFYVATGVPSAVFGLWGPKAARSHDQTSNFFAWKVPQYPGIAGLAALSIVTAACALLAVALSGAFGVSAAKTYGFANLVAGVGLGISVPVCLLALIRSFNRRSLLWMMLVAIGSLAVYSGAVLFNHIGFYIAAAVPSLLFGLVGPTPSASSQEALGAS